MRADVAMKVIKWTRKKHLLIAAQLIRVKCGANEKRNLSAYFSLSFKGANLNVVITPLRNSFLWTFQKFKLID